jgi:hypothetical protein
MVKGSQKIEAVLSWLPQGTVIYIFLSFLVLVSDHFAVQPTSELRHLVMTLVRTASSTKQATEPVTTVAAAATTIITEATFVIGRGIRRVQRQIIFMLHKQKVGLSVI